MVINDVNFMKNKIELRIETQTYQVNSMQENAIKTSIESVNPTFTQLNSQ